MKVYDILEDAFMIELEKNSVFPTIISLEPGVFDKLRSELLSADTRQKLDQNLKRFSVSILGQVVEVRSDEFDPEHKFLEQIH